MPAMRSAIRSVEQARIIREADKMAQRPISSLLHKGMARRHIPAMVNSYEKLRAALDDIIERYRAGVVGDRTRATLNRKEAIELIKALGFTEGDAMRWLDSKRRSLV
ncbi:MAG: hypothetical protein ACLQJR_03275 [Stellaceae bacterium]